MGRHAACSGAVNHSSEKVLEKQESLFRKGEVFCYVWICEQVGGDGDEVAEGPTGLDLEAEDRGARPGAVGQDAPQNGAGQEHPFRFENLERRGRRKGKCFCLPSLRFDGASRTWHKMRCDLAGRCCKGPVSKMGDGVSTYLQEWVSSPTLDDAKTKTSKG